MKRRRFLQYGAAGALLAGCDNTPFAFIPPWLPISVLKPGMTEGHRLRELKQLPVSSGERRIDTLIIGSGVAGLTAAWRLQQQGYRRFALLTGSELYGNASAGHWQDVSFPRGAHYLPLPTMESVHIREMLAAWGIIEANPFSLQPTYDERAILHAPDERLWINSQWHDGLLPPPANATARQQLERFVKHTRQLQGRRGNDGKPIFAIPLAASSQDPLWRALDQLSFSEWLNQQGFTDPGLRWYLDYCCRDDFGLNSPQISTWAGLHFFASRNGQAAGLNPDSDLVLTWPEGLNHLAQKMLPEPQHLWPGFAINIKEHTQGVDVLYWAGNRAFTVKAKRVICATPLHVTARLFGQIKDYGFDPQHDVPTHAPWLVSNLYLDRFPLESHDNELAWDNVVYGSQSLGYVVATHQWLRAAKPQYTVFSAYHALAEHSPSDSRRWLHQATPADLMELGLGDLQQVYGTELWRGACGLEMTVRGHAMPSPTVGFLGNKGRQALQDADGKVLFAHSDLSGYAIFEEASWWGWLAAQKILS